MNIKPLHENIAILQGEIHKNTKVMDYLIDNVSGPEADVAERLGILAAYFNIQMDGFYNINEVCEILIKELRKANSIIIYN